ncbi:transposase [Rhizobium laguerreae]
MEPGASVSAIAHRIGIHPSQLFGWRAMLVPDNDRFRRIRLFR